MKALSITFQHTFINLHTTQSQLLEKTPLKPTYTYVDKYRDISIFRIETNDKKKPKNENDWKHVF